jgi:Flp pilus assembly protein CpaB
MRAMEVPGDANQLLAGIIQDGDHVDVVANIRYSLRASAVAASNISLVASRVVLRNLLVLKAPSPPSSSGIAGAGANGTSITLAVTDTDAQKLLFVLKNGDWWLALRPVASPADSPDSVETLQSLLGDGLGTAQVGQLTDGLGKGSITGGNG